MDARDDDDNKEMFKECFLKLKHVYDDLVARTYTAFLLNSTWTLLMSYAIVAVLLSLALVQVRMDEREPEKLTYVRNSEALRHYALLNRTFSFDQHKRNFVNKQLTVAYYVEVIACVRAPNSTTRRSNDDLLRPEFNMINRYVCVCGEGGKRKV